MKKTLIITASIVLGVALIFLSQDKNTTDNHSSMTTFKLNAQETECYRLGFVNIDPRLQMSDTPWNKNFTLLDVTCQYYKAAPEYPYQVEAHGTVSDQLPDYTSSRYQEIQLKQLSFYGLYNLEYSEECLIIDNETIYSEVWQGGEQDPHVTKGTARCRWLSDEEVAKAN